jgi:hypothetical protein
MNEKFDNIVRNRIYQRVPFGQIEAAGIAEFYVAGNSLNKQPPNDIDIFPVGNPFTKEQAQKLGFIVCETRNAITVKVNLDSTMNHHTVDGENEINIGGRTVTVQLCNYHHENLEKLVNSFDFAHIQIGAKVDRTGIEVYYTKAYEDSKLCQSTEYIGSEYPLSSLLRAFKYAKRGDFAGNSHIFSVLKVLTDIVHRGFDDFNDFKDQMDAIDLGLVPENKEEMSEAGFSGSENTNVLDKLMNFLILGKKAICKDAEIAYNYAQVLGGRFEEGEKAISKNAELSLQYAKNIIKGRFEKGEEVISKHVELSLVYASLIKERFEKGEEAIAQNGSYSLFNYWNFIKKDNSQRLPENLHNMMIVWGMEKDYHAKLYLANFMDKAA